MRPNPCLVRRLRMIGLGACLLCTALVERGRGGEWSLPDGRMGIRTAPLLLLTRPDVQSELSMTPAQIDSTSKTVEDLSRRGQALRGRTGADVVAERRAIDDAQSHWLTANLSPTQLDRLSQIDLQWEGSSALVSRPTVVDALKLSGRQIRDLARLIADRNARIRKNGYNPSDEAEVRRQSLAILTNPQLQAWNGMLGEHCRFTTTTPPAAPAEDPAAQQAEHVAPR